MENVLIYHKNDNKAQSIAEDISCFLNEQGLKVDFLCSIESIDKINKKIDLVVAVGGDGSFLGAVRSINNVVPKDEKLPPVLGVHSGSLGFLTESTVAAWKEVIAKGLLEGFTIEERTMLGVHFGDANQVFSSLNDVVVSRNSVARMINFDLFYNNEFISNIRADGVIVSTPTGSTAYSLASGGPIMHPSVAGFIVNPVSPHTLTNRPIVLPDEGKIELSINTNTDDVVVTVDGQKAINCPPSQKVIVESYFRPLRLIRPFNISYFDILRSKLSFGKRG